MKRGPYAEAHEAELRAIDAERRRQGVSIEQLAARAGMTERQLRRLLKSGRAFRRRLLALQAALRALKREAKEQDRYFEGTADAD